MCCWNSTANRRSISTSAISARMTPRRFLASALVFPLQIFNPARPDNNVVRTILAVDRDRRSMTFAGDMPEGWTAQLMRGNFDRLSAGAANAARQAQAGIGEDGGVAILVSCIGRRLLMGQRSTDEVEAAGAELGDKTDAPRLLFVWRNFAACGVRRLRTAQPDDDRHRVPRSAG